MNLFAWLMTSYTWLLLAYAFGLSLFLLDVVRRLASKDDWQTKARDIKIERLPIDKQVGAIAKLSEINKNEIPWHERSISTIGVVSFFSMLLVTGVQTARVTLQEQRVERLSGQLEQLREQRSGLESVVSKVARAILVDYRKGAVLDQGARDVLRFRMRSLEASGSRSGDEISELFEISLVLGDSFKAVKLVEEHSDLLESTVPSNAVSIAEHYFLLGEDDKALETIAEVDSRRSQISPALRMRMIVLEAASGPNIDPYIREISKMLRISKREAELRLRNDIDALNTAVQRVRSGQIHDE